jgi:hypothetical protein
MLRFGVQALQGAVQQIAVAVVEVVAVTEHKLYLSRPGK